MANTPAVYHPAPGKINANTVIVQVKPADEEVDESAIHCFDKEGDDKHAEIGKSSSNNRHAVYIHVALTFLFSPTAHGCL